MTDEEKREFLERLVRRIETCDTDADRLRVAQGLKAGLRLTVPRLLRAQAGDLMRDTPNWKLYRAVAAEFDAKTDWIEHSHAGVVEK